MHETAKVSSSKIVGYILHVGTFNSFTFPQLVNLIRERERPIGRYLGIPKIIMIKELHKTMSHSDRCSIYFFVVNSFFIEAFL